MYRSSETVLWMEMPLDECVSGENFLGLTSRFEPLNPAAYRTV
jgi:hypothetical protein